MFAPETEDMLPRSAPRPSASAPLGLAADQIVRPTVPEVSILFGQPPSQPQPEPIPQQPAPESDSRPSFASWKKQMLPRVNFSPILATELGPRPVPASANFPSSPSASSNDYYITPRERVYANEAPSSKYQSPRHSGSGYAEPVRHYHQSMRPPVQVATDVLTICAGTQTEAVHIPPSKTTLPSVVYSDIDISNLVNKNDLAAVVDLLESMHQEQQQLRSLCEALLKNQQAKVGSSAMPCRTVASQCDILATNNTKRVAPVIHDYIVEEDEPSPAPRSRGLVQFQSPRDTPPRAQSTEYRANTPKTTRMPSAGVVSKPNTEKSMVMKELALKYLRQPVDDLMQEMSLSPSPADVTCIQKSPQAEPLRQIDNINVVHSQSPNDMSNASYKYLKKYRLLPEEQLDYGAHEQERNPPPFKGGRAASASPQMQLDLDNIRNQPKLL
ncbi:uncharacterized protein ana2 [Drosophila pseudoobscura]|uniref:Uncharacterized protein ana2 n=1 Tax=Drosophila pseudoobscura pseudoobscura TaxID=46245 RepID=A0A6I8UVJ4_DROPS|nr:uncharacterized protein LOC4805081 [Drosophila pseudoobscura]